MCGDVPPLIQFFQVGQPGVVCRVVGRHVEAESEAFEVGFEIVEVRVTAIKISVRCELALYEDPERGPDSRRDDLGAFRVKIAAESLKMRGQKQDERTEILVRKAGICGRRQTAGLRIAS